MIMKFIAHAGFALTSGKTTVMIDPWFFCSDAREPIIQGLLPGNSTVDFMVPDCRDEIRDFKPDAILFSHFEATHAPLKETKMLIEQAARQVVISGPMGKPDQDERLAASLGKLGSSVRIVSMGAGGEVRFSVGDMKIVGWAHTQDHHAAWYIESPTGSFLHIADARINRDRWSRELDPTWNKFKNLRPDLLAVSAAGHSMRRDFDGPRWIIENSTMSPVEAARLALLIKPKRAAVMGLNHSQWARQVEFPMPAEYVESAFSWALLYLDRTIKVHTLRPGDQLNFNDRSARAQKAPYRQPEV